jgi:hypothetical protein
VGYSHSERTGVLIVRVWTEGDQGKDLRARITRSLDIAAASEVVSAASSIDEVLAGVRSWLEEFVG